MLKKTTTALTTFTRIAIFYKLHLQLIYVL